ncbi:DUF982 domain-containing protein [Rhizobium sp. BK650]|uniref:DUF982 domain-containing protein n=1 Tax=Rhizobium sp. BK650 TaxID=2586990 RepID=UPI0016186ED5|nr:DUF982 domain-containing protein [Rhizobium sp. BK650]
MKDRPSDGGDEFLAATEACLDVMIGRTDPSELRKAIIRAAEGSGVATITVLH